MVVAGLLDLTLKYLGKDKTIVHRDKGAGAEGELVTGRDGKGSWVAGVAVLGCLMAWMWLSTQYSGEEKAAFQRGMQREGSGKSLVGEGTGKYMGRREQG